MAARLPELFFYVFFCFRAAVPSVAKRKVIFHGECGKLERIMLLKKPLEKKARLFMTYRTVRIGVAYRLRKSAALPSPCFMVSHVVKTTHGCFYLLADYSPFGRSATSDS